MGRESPSPLRVLVANGDRERIEQIASVVNVLGHDVVARDTALDEVGALTAAERPDVALVILGESSEHALGLIGRIVKEATCPVIAILDVTDRDFINEAAKLGIFAYVVAPGTSEASEELQSSIDIVLRRFAEYHELEGAFGRRAVTERAKGILMERHCVDERAAFAMLRDHSRRTNRKVVDVAEAVVGSHRLLPSPLPEGRPQIRQDQL
jgi:AmiR/NasT family two-component response regulator